MSSPVDRVHFYERQYLRAFDLAAEQAYHLEMRRRLNLALHLWGIVAGFNVAKGEVVPGAPEQVIISTGMAIDGFGREIVLPAAYALSDDDLRRNRIVVAGNYWLSVVYRPVLTTPPAAGYRLCDVADQYTRWHESLAFLITDVNPTPTTLPDVTDPLPDDPTRHEWPVVLGKLGVISSSGTLTIDSATLDGRTYVGSRTQRLVSPASSLGSGAGEPQKPITITADALEEKNFSVGADFDVPVAKVIPAPTTVPFPAASGNVKVGTDLFVRGEIYKYIAATDQWLALKDHLRQFVPDVKVKTKTIVPATPAVAVQPVTGVEEIEIETVLNAPSDKQFIVSVAAIKTLNDTERGTWLTNTPNNETWIVDVHFEPPAVLVAGTKTWKFPVRWTVSPMATAGTVPILVKELTVSCIAVFQP